MPRDSMFFTREFSYAVTSGPVMLSPCAGYDMANISVDGTASTGRIAIYGAVSPSGPWQALHESITDSGISGPIDIRGYAYIGYAVTIAQTASGILSGYLAVTGEAP